MSQPAPALSTALGRGGGVGGLLLLPFAVVIVYPRESLAWLSGKTGKTYDFRHVVWLECAAIVGMLLFAFALNAMSSRFKWYEPLFALGAVVLVRLLRALVSNVLGFDD
jgi:hypothetical protein